MDFLAGYTSGDQSEEVSDDEGMKASPASGRTRYTSVKSQVSEKRTENVVVSSTSPPLKSARSAAIGRRKIPLCQALLDDEDPSHEAEGDHKLADSCSSSTADEPQPKHACTSTTPHMPVVQPHAPDTNVAGSAKGIRHVLDRPPLQIASLATVPRSHRPACKPPGRKVHAFHKHTASVLKLAWHDPHGQLLASCGMDGQLCIWDPWIQRACVQQLQPHGSQAIRCGQWHATASSNTMFLSGGYDKCLRLTDVETGQCALSLAHDAYVTAVTRHPSRRDVVLTGTSRHAISAWDLRSGKKLHDFVPAVGQIQDILFLPDTEHVVVACDTHRRSDADRSLGVWDFQSGVRLVDQMYPEPYSCTRLLLDKSQKNVLAQSNSGHVAIFHAAAPCKLNKYKRFQGHQVSGFPMGCCVSPDGQYLYSPSADGRLFCYGYHSSKAVKTWHVDRHQQAQSAVIDVVHHPLLPSALATSSWDGEVCLWL